MTKRECAEQDPTLTDPNVEFDYALPQQWVDDVYKVTGVYPAHCFVWLYDAKAKLFGRPYPLTPEGEELLAQYQHKLELYGRN